MSNLNIKYRAHYCCIIFLLLGAVMFACNAPARLENSGTVSKTDSIILEKNFNLLAVLGRNSGWRKQLSGNASLERVRLDQQNRIKKALDECTDMTCLVNALCWRDTEIKTIGDQLMQIQELPAQLKTQHYYINYETLPDTVMVRKAWNDVAAGINRVLNVYLAGKRPAYPAIDSINFKKGDPAFLQRVRSTIKSAVNAGGDLFYTVPLTLALRSLALNDRDEPARYEPLTGGMNASPYAAVSHTNWNAYTYSAVLVPGYSSDIPGIGISARGKLRCRDGVQRYKAGLAPFIIVSGGHVHPAHTPFSEAVEMKKFMVDSMGVPGSAVIIEPHARHTTTNLRNAVRIIYRFGMPAEKPVLVVTDDRQASAILNMESRCMRELGYVPYKGVKKLGEQEVLFYPIMNAFQANPSDPLDP